MSHDRNQHDPLEAIFGTILEVTSTATEEEQRELLAEIDRRRELSRLERENAIMRTAIRRSRHYLRLASQPGGLSAKDCLTGLLQTLDNDDINEVTRR